MGNACLYLGPLAVAQQDLRQIVHGGFPGVRVHQEAVHHLVALLLQHTATPQHVETRASQAPGFDQIYSNVLYGKQFTQSAILWKNTGFFSAVFSCLLK